MAINPDTKPDLNKDNGFTMRPYAIKKVVRTPEGGTQVIYVDSRTGRQVNPKGYTIIQSDNVVDNTKLGAEPQKNVSQGTDVTTAAQPTQNSTSALDAVLGRGSQDNNVSKAVETSKQDNYGYVNKPAALGFAGMLPGPLGLLGIATNLGINTSNADKVAKQREALGFSDQPGKQAAGTVFDGQGYIGEAKVTRADGTKTVTPVGFEAQDKYNRTTYTPEEARRHQQLAGLEEATPEERQAAIGTFNGQFPQSQSFASKVIEASKGFMGNIFGGGQTASPSGAGTGSGFNTSGGGSGAYGNSSFPSAPSAPTNTSTGIDSARGPNPPDTSGYGPGLY